MGWEVLGTQYLITWLYIIWNCVLCPQNSKEIISKFEELPFVNLL